MLKFRIAKLEEVAEEYRGLYQQDPNGQGFVLAVEGAVDRSRLDEFRQSNTELKQKIEAGNATMQELEAFKKQFGDHDIEHVLAALETQRRAEEKELLDKGEIDTLIERRTKEMKKNHADELSRTTQELTKSRESSDAYRNRYKDLLIESRVLDSISKYGILRQGARQDVINRATSVWNLDEDGENLVASLNGENLFSAEDATKPLPIDEWASGLVRDSAYLFESTTGLGSQGGQDSNSQSNTQGFVSSSDEAAKSANIEAIASGKVQVVS